MQYQYPTQRLTSLTPSDTSRMHGSHRTLSENYTPSQILPAVQAIVHPRLPKTGALEIRQMPKGQPDGRSTAEQAARTLYNIIYYVGKSLALSVTGSQISVVR